MRQLIVSSNRSLDIQELWSSKIRFLFLSMVTLILIDNHFECFYLWHSDTQEGIATMETPEYDKRLSSLNTKSLDVFGVRISRTTRVPLEVLLWIRQMALSKPWSSNRYAERCFASTPSNSFCLRPWKKAPVYKVQRRHPLNLDLKLLHLAWLCRATSTRLQL